MGFWEIFLIAVGLSMDAFAVSVSKGLAAPKHQQKGALLCGIWFGTFQMLMPLAGCFLGTHFTKYILPVDHWVAFALLACIGGNMCWDAFGETPEHTDSSYAPSRMFPLAVATAIDALAVGVTLAVFDTDIIAAVLQIGITTFLFSMAGGRIGALFGEKYASRAQIAGGLLLICMGLHILSEHLDIFPALC